MYEDSYLYKFLYTVYSIHNQHSCVCIGILCTRIVIYINFCRLSILYIIKHSYVCIGLLCTRTVIYINFCILSIPYIISTRLLRVMGLPHDRAAF